jgi:hypothetical protein
VDKQRAFTADGGGGIGMRRKSIEEREAAAEMMQKQAEKEAAEKKAAARENEMMGHTRPRRASVNAWDLSNQPQAAVEAKQESDESPDKTRDKIGPRVGGEWGERQQPGPTEPSTWATATGARAGPQGAAGSSTAATSAETATGVKAGAQWTRASSATATASATETAAATATEASRAGAQWPATGSSATASASASAAVEPQSTQTDQRLGRELPKGRLSIKCIEGQDFRRKDDVSKVARTDPYIRFRLGAAERHPWKSTQVKKKQTMNPNFDGEIVLFNVIDPAEYVLAGDMQLAIEVWNKGSIKDELLGSVTMSVVRFLRNPFITYEEMVPVYLPGQQFTKSKVSSAAMIILKPAYILPLLCS